MHMSTVRPWIFRLLVLAAAGFLVWTWFQPWWNADVNELTKHGVVIHPWGLWEDLGFASIYVEDAKMPGWFAPLMWTYLGIVVASLLFSLFARDKEFKVWKIKFRLPSFIIWLVGFSYIIVAVIGVVFMAIRMKGFFGGVPLNGRITIDLGEPMVGHVDTSLQIGYYLTYAAGLLLIVLALLRDKISGRKLA